MIGRLFARTEKMPTVPAPLPGRARLVLPDPLPTIYAVGDAHGCLRELEAAEARIVADAAGEPGAKVIVHLGDHVDRGPCSAQVLDRLTAPPPAGFQRISLAGNHDDMMLRFIEDPKRNMDWLDVGGEATLRSYGLDLSRLLQHSGTGRLSDILADAIPERHVDFLRDLPVSVSAGTFLFVHAGLRPGIPLARQSDEDLMWIREPFLSRGPGLEMTVVHGHSPTKEPHFGSGRIGIDTAAYATGRLTVLKVSRGFATIL